MLRSCVFPPSIWYLIEKFGAEPRGQKTAALQRRADRVLRAKNKWCQTIWSLHPVPFPRQALPGRPNGCRCLRCCRGREGAPPLSFELRTGRLPILSLSRVYVMQARPARPRTKKSAAEPHRLPCPRHKWPSMQRADLEGNCPFITIKCAGHRSPSVYLRSDTCPFTALSIKTGR